MLHLTSLRPYFFPQKDKIKHYEKAIKNQNRKLIQISFFEKEGSKFLVYRPCHQTHYGVKHNKWRLSNQNYFSPKVSYQSISENDYSKLEQTVITTCWHNNSLHFCQELEKFLFSEDKAAEYESHQITDLQ